ncbi:hypothetical protein NITGR_100017 [Nitrospina gracilis 3/211]|uniref:Uncharacterized protein n=1 Tax=Nitrospina gracilis (strain 3/211) TaxID=1266370 RepID=M1YUF9_NITG3|nr:hypothetical protein NITGR_100017 [Nitrospina gracilis 3/211]
MTKPTGKIPSPSGKQRLPVIQNLNFNLEFFFGFWVPILWQTRAVVIILNSVDHIDFKCEINLIVEPVPARSLRKPLGGSKPVRHRLRAPLTPYRVQLKMKCPPRVQPLQRKGVLYEHSIRGQFRRRHRSH